MSDTPRWKAPLCDRHATEHAVRTGCVVCAAQERYDALRRLMPFVVDGYQPLCSTPEFAEAVEKAMAILEEKDRP